MPQYIIRQIDDDGKIDDQLALVVKFPGTLMQMLEALSDSRFVKPQPTNKGKRNKS